MNLKKGSLMSDEQFKLGDVVRHKSGTGPAMVVIEIKGEDEGMALNCEWVDDFGETQSRVYKAFALRKSS
ncbi:DUF2158 domain-containing protein [Alloalcanivorax xenomutans]|uniref:DUF2158 domain-containing protein n=2 Tax=Alloalcanivorax xenomutans TaxID=1094342 RepID=UPI003C79DF8A